MLQERCNTDAVLDSASGAQPDSLSVRSNPVGSIHLAPWMETEYLSRDVIGTAGGTMVQKCSSSNHAPSCGSKKLCQETGGLFFYAIVLVYLWMLDSDILQHILLGLTCSADVQNQS